MARPRSRVRRRRRRNDLTTSARDAWRLGDDTQSFSDYVTATVHRGHGVYRLKTMQKRSRHGRRRLTQVVTVWRRGTPELQSRGSTLRADTFGIAVNDDSQRCSTGGLDKLGTALSEIYAFQGPAINLSESEQRVTATSVAPWTRRAERLTWKVSMFTRPERCGGLNTATAANDQIL